MERPHITVRQDAKLPPGTSAFIHWSSPLVPQPPHGLIESVPDTLEHVAACLPYEQALVVWESASTIDRMHPDVLTRIAWRTTKARRLAAAARGQSDSGLETLFVTRLTPWGVVVRQQVWIAGHDVDVLIGDRLIVQLDGFAFHSTPADRQRDLAHDRELRSRGYTVLRFTYRDVVTDWARVEETLARHLAQGHHLAR
ncbi:MAG: superfamily and helicase and helicase subunit [Microbacterium sp.]|nr:superfamily and helicase and helicase subunit [Microbacterium sp.]